MYPTLAAKTKTRLGWAPSQARCGLRRVWARRPTRQPDWSPAHQVRLTDELVDHLAVGVDQGESQRHLAEGVGGAAQAWIEGADHGFDTIQSALGELTVLDVSASRLQHALVHGVVIVEEPVVGRTVVAEYKLATSNQAAVVEYSKSATELVEVFPQRIVPIPELDDLWYTYIELRRHRNIAAQQS